MKKQNGITLVALVITIIVLLILAGVTINLTLGERGIFRIAQKAAQESEIAAYQEKIELARVEVSSKNMGKVTIEDLVAQIYKDNIVPDGNMKIVENYAIMTTPEKYTILVTTEKTEYIPGGKIEAPGDINDYIETGDITVEQTPGSETYTKESVKITITTKIENQKIQYSVDNGTTYKDYTGAFNVYENKTIYIVLRNALGEIGNYTTTEVTNIDTEAPVITKVEATATTITFSATDNLSGIVGYKVTESGTEPTEYDEIESTTSIENKEVSVEKQNTDYYVWVKDKAGNVSACSTTKTTTQPVTSITIAPSSATIKPGETVNLTATINPSNAFNQAITWNTGNSGIATVNNGTVTAVAAGTTIITATAQDGSDIQGSCTITVSNPLLSAQITAANYGDYVNYEDGLNLGSSTYGHKTDWRIFYEDTDGYVYLISSYLLPWSQVPSGTNLSAYSGRPYTAYWPSGASGYTTAAETSYARYKMNFKYNGSYNNGYQNMYCVSQLMNTSVWNTKFKNATYAEDAIGAPTLEMWVASWNEKSTAKSAGYTTLSTSIPNQNGYYINGSYSINLSGNAGYNDNLYFPLKSGSDSAGYHYWLASPSAYYTYSLMCVAYGGYVTSTDYGSYALSVRPLVRLKSTVCGEKDANEVWQLQ